MSKPLLPQPQEDDCSLLSTKQLQSEAGPCENARDVGEPEIQVNCAFYFWHTDLRWDLDQLALQRVQKTLSCAIFKKKKLANIRQTPCSAGVAGPAHLGHFFVGEVDL